MRTHKVAVLPGDGVGPELMEQALRVLSAAGRRFGFAIHQLPGLIGAAALKETGRVLPAETLQCSKASAAILVGPIAGELGYTYTDLNHPKQGLIKLRSWLGSYATLRPIQGYRCLGAASPLRADQAAPDLVLVYDHSSGLYYGRPHGIAETGNGRIATNTMIYTTTEVRRTAELACQVARGRRKQVLSVDHAKVLETGRLWAETVGEVARDFPDVHVSRRDVQHFFYDLVTDPSAYDVVLSEMATGELIAATAAGLTGTFAVHAAAYLGGDVPLFQPSHGAAVQLATRDEADPIGMIRAAALMLTYALDEPAAAAAIEGAVEAVLGEEGWPGEIGVRKTKLAAPCAGGRARLGTRAIADAVIDRLRAVRAPTAGGAAAE